MKLIVIQERMMLMKKVGLPEITIWVVIYIIPGSIGIVSNSVSEEVQYDY